MVFNSEAELKAYLLPKIINAVRITELKVYAKTKSTLVDFYGEFSPDEYIRTNALLHSLKRTGAMPTGNGAIAEVYFDPPSYQTGVMQLQSTPITGRLGYATWSGQQVLDTAMAGSHGGFVSGTPIWSTSLGKLGDVEGLLVQELQAQGIPIG